jgi:putative ABC transport system permease protein
MKEPPPALARALLRLLLPEEEREFFLGDLEEGKKGSWTREVMGAVTLRFRRRPTQGKMQPKTGDGIMRELLFDLKHGLRLMGRSPIFTAVALLTMALGIGANTAIFSLLHGVLLKPLPFPEPDRIVFLQERNLSMGFEAFSVPPLDFWDWEERNRSMEKLAAFRRSSVNFTGGDRPESLSAYRVTEEFLPILGGTPSLGRAFTRGDVLANAEPTVILSYGEWQRTFGGSNDVLDRAMTLDGIRHTIIGVLPQGWQFSGRTPADIILPLTPQPHWYTNRNSHFIYALGRIAPDISLEQARTDFASISSGLEEEFPDSNEGWEAIVTPLEEVLVGSTGPQLLLFMVSVGLILLIACANLANMTLARATQRSRELAIRTAVGAGRGRVIRQILTESVLLATLGGALGVGLAFLALEAFVTGWPTLLPRLREVELSGTVLLFSFGVSLASGVLFGLIPAINVAGSNLTDALRQGGRGMTGGRSRRWVRTFLVSGEMALAVVLLVGTGLLVRSFSALQAEDPGFETDHRLVFSTPLATADFPNGDALRAYGEEVLSNLNAIPGVERAAYSSLIPLEGSDQVWGYWLEERAVPDSESDGSALFYRVSPGYFEAMGTPLLAGRGIGPEDRVDGPQVVVISASLAERHFPEGNALGRSIKFGTDPEDPSLEIVGVAGDVQHYHVGQSAMPQIYVSFNQRPTGDIHFALQSSGSPLGLVDEVRAAVAAVNPNQPLLRIQLAEALVEESISTPRFRTLLMAAFGLTALLLAVVGLYGVMAYTVSQRRKEIGVRMALGADKGSVLSMVFREGIPLVGGGMVLGLGGAFALSRILESMLFGVGTRDPVVFVSVPAILTLVALSAMLIPARRATQVDPVQTLGEE